MIQTEINTVYKSHILILSAGKQIYMNGPWVVGDLIVRHLEYKFNSLTTPPIRGPTFNSKAKQECQLKRDKRELLGICTVLNFKRINEYTALYMVQVLWVSTAQCFHYCLHNGFTYISSWTLVTSGTFQASHWLANTIPATHAGCCIWPMKEFRITVTAWLKHGGTLSYKTDTLIANRKRLNLDIISGSVIQRFVLLVSLLKSLGGSPKAVASNQELC